MKKSEVDHMKKNILVMLFDGIKGQFISEVLYNNMTREKALICFIEQYQGNYNTFSYPETINGIYKSHFIHDLLYDIDDNLTIYAQYA